MNKFEIAKTVDFTEVIAEPVRILSKGYMLISNNSLKIFECDGKWFYRDFGANNDKGSGIDYLVNKENYSLKEAVDLLVKHAGYNVEDLDNEYRQSTKINKTIKRSSDNVSRKDKISTEKSLEITNNIIKEFKKLQPEKKQEKIKMNDRELEVFFKSIISKIKVHDNFGTYRYLVNFRKIDIGIFNFFYKQGYLIRALKPNIKENYNPYYEFNKSYDKHIQNDETTTGFVCINPLTKKTTGLMLRANRDLRKFKGNKKAWFKNIDNTKWGFGFLKGKPYTMTIIEAPLDVLSYISINKNQNKLKNNYIVAMGGNNQDMMMDNIAELRSSGLSKVIIATDADNAGEEMFKGLKDRINNLYNDLEVERERPSENIGKDWNDYLTK